MQTDKRKSRQQKELTRLYQEKPVFVVKTTKSPLPTKNNSLVQATNQALNLHDLSLSLITTGFLLLLQLVVSKLIK